VWPNTNTEAHILVFEEGTARFEVGDLAQYLRREKGSDRNAATEFRHLRRMLVDKK
jgi:hypothetical protein